MHYFRKGLERCVAERPENARRLISEGWQPCSAETHRELWQIADARQRAESRQAPTMEPPITFAIPTLGMSREWN